MATQLLGGYLADKYGGKKVLAGGIAWFSVASLLLPAATQQIRNYERTHLSGREVPIIAMTAFSLPEDQEKCLECGMNDYISKPFTKERLRDKVRLSGRWLVLFMQMDSCAI